MPRALLIDDHSGTIAALAGLVEREGFSTISAGSLGEARAKLAQQPPDVIFLDLQLPDGDGMSLIDELDPETSPAVVLITGHASVETAVEAVRRGVSDYLTKPLDVERLRGILKEIAGAQALKSEIGRLKAKFPEAGGFGHMVGASSAMKSVYDLIARVAPTSATVLISGESGVGKELAARTIHDLSRRREGRFVAVNCGAVSPSLMESELFGHERGSFTGAERRHRGVFEQASGGTLFLDEITEMPIDLQVKLLRVLETGSLTRTGGESPISVSVRFVAATNRNAEEAVRQNKLRDDLYYRLKVFGLLIPPLRDRSDDVPLLTTHFLQQVSQSEGGPLKSVAPETLEKLRKYHWPGNVREFKNAIYSGYILSGDVLEPSHLPSEVLSDGSQEVFGPSLHVRVGSPLAEVERRLILATLAQFDGNKTKTADVLGISLKTLYNRLQEYKQPEAPAESSDGVIGAGAGRE